QRLEHVRDDVVLAGVGRGPVLGVQRRDLAVRGGRGEAGQERLSLVRAVGELRAVRREEALQVRERGGIRQVVHYRDQVPVGLRVLAGLEDAQVRAAGEDRCRVRAVLARDGERGPVGLVRG